MAAQTTKDRILKAAENLFAESGFSGTSLRQLTQEANVNLAAVNYHFGSKENLILEVFRRHLDGLYRRREEALDEVERVSGGQPELRDVLEAFVYPAMAVGFDSSDTESPFVKVLARAFVEYRDELRQFLSDHYGEINRRFFQGIARHLTHLDPEEAYARLDFMIGALTYAMADFGVFKRPPDLPPDEYWRAKAERLVIFAEAGLKAPAARLESPLPA
ncbi:MAG: TetR family transcriptional regulator [Xanthomonadales bacterium]|nr:TetR family transcriptional regulator [Xanthomonadales bacterium]